MEAVGVAAAALQFAGTSIKLLKALRAVRNKVKDTPSDIESWRKELEDVRGLIESIQHLPSHHGIDLAVTINACEATCQKLLNIFDTFEFSDADTVVKKTWRVTKGLDQEHTIRNLFQDLYSQKVNLVLKLGVSHSGQLRNLHQDVRVVARDLRTILSQSRVRIGSEEEMCLQALFLTDPASNRDAIVTTKGKRVFGTCEWILLTNIYNTWLNSEESPNLLWISGGPGKGKTFLSIFLTEKLSESPSRTVIYYFFDNQIDERNSAIALLRGLIYQLVVRHSQLIHHLLKPWRLQQEILFEDSSFESLWSVFSEMLAALDRENVDVILVIDALDEMQETYLQPVLAKLCNIFGQVKIPSFFKAVIISRSYPRIIPNSLVEFPNLQLDPIHDTDILSDINLYINHKVAEISIRGGYFKNTDLVQYIKQTFQERSEGTFLWVSLMAAELQTIYLSEIETAIKNLPRGLNAIYRRILYQIPTKEQPLTRKLLKWVALAQRPLFVAELAEALGIPDSDRFSKWEICLDMISSCGHMLRLSIDGEPILPELGRLNSLSPGEVAAWSTTVSFVHQSAKDFLKLSEAQGGFDKFKIQMNQDHLEVTNHLLEYFEACDTNAFNLLTRCKEVDASIVRADLVHRYPLLSYASNSWFVHMGKLDDKHVDILCQKNPFFGENPSARDKWTDYMHCIGSQQSIPLLNPVGWNFTLLQLACELQLVALVRWVLIRNQSMPFRKQYINKMIRRYQKREFGRPGGHLSSFVSEAADYIYGWAAMGAFQLIGRDGPLSALDISCRRANAPIMRLLMEAGGGLSRSSAKRALCQAVQSGHLEILDLLVRMEKNARTFIQEESGKIGHMGSRSLLCLAAECGDAQYCELLLDKYKYSITQTWIGSGDPVILAIGNDHMNLARLLVKRWGANIDDTGDRHWSLLEATKSIDALKFVTEEFGVNINTRRPILGTTILHEVMERSQTVPWLYATKCHVFLQACLDQGVNPTLLDGCGATPMHVLSDPDISTISLPCLVVLLRDGRLSIDSPDAHGQTLLHHVIASPFRPNIKPSGIIEWSLKSLLDLGCNRFIKMRSKPNQTMRDIFAATMKTNRLFARLYETEISELLDFFDHYTTVSNHPSKLDPMDWEWRPYTMIDNLSPRWKRAIGVIELY